MGGAVSAAGKIAQGAAAKKAGKEQQKQYETEAKQVEITTAEEEKSFVEGAKEFQTEQLAAMGASGAVIDTRKNASSYVTTSGSGDKKTFGENLTAEMSTPLKMAIQTARKIEEDRYQLVREGQWQAASLRKSGKIAKQQGNAQFVAGMFGSASTLLGTAYNVSTLLRSRNKTEGYSRRQ